MNLRLAQKKLLLALLMVHTLPRELNFSNGLFQVTTRVVAGGRGRAEKFPKNKFL